MRDLVDGPAHEAWQEAAACLLRPSMRSLPRHTGLEWQIAIGQAWVLQRTLRTASLQHVHRMKDCYEPGYGSFWVASAAPHPRCYLMSRSSTGAMTLLDPSQKAAQPKQLALKSKAERYAFIPSDGRLHIVELISSPLMQPPCAHSLRWHTFDAATGQTLASEQKHMWLDGRCQFVYHASGRVLGLVDPTMLAIMDAVTLHELARCDITPRHFALQHDMVDMLAEVAWSASGSMLAIARAGPARDGVGRVGEVHMYDTASGQCLQHVMLRARNIKLLWSHGSDQLGVHSRGLPEDCGSANGASELRVLRPFSKGVAEVDCVVQACPSALWAEQFEWSPQGHLLVAWWDNPARHEPWPPPPMHGCTVFDANTLQHVFTYKHAVGCICWAADPTSSLRSPHLSAYFTGLGMHVTFHFLGGGQWEYKKCEQTWPYDRRWHTVEKHAFSRLSPDGAAIVGFFWLALQHPCIFHLSLDTSASEGFVRPRRSPLEPIKPSWLQWAPLPPCSSHQIYAFLHEEAATSTTAGKRRTAGTSMRPAAISLVDSGRITALDTWSVQQLSQQAEGRRLRTEPAGQAHRVKWASNGKHLAVLCGECTLVMTLGTSS